MPADLRFQNYFHNTSLVLEDDALAMLESDGNADRVRRVLFAGIENVQVWRVAPLGRIILFVVILGLPAVGIAFINEVPAYVVSGVLLLATLGIVANYLNCGKTTIQIMSRGEAQKFVMIARPKKIERFLTRLQEGVIKAQERAHAAAALQMQQQTPPPTNDVESAPPADETPAPESAFPPPPPEAGPTPPA